jgi:Uma2 family endonuclease
MARKEISAASIIREGEPFPPPLRDRLLQRLSDALEEPWPYVGYEEFLEWIDEDTRAEWVDGVIIMTSPASYRHQNISGFLHASLRGFVENHGLGVVLAAPFQMKLERSGREPDLLFVATENLQRLKPTYLDGPADLVIEIIAPECAGRDRGDKFYEYERAKIPEYWLIDPEMERVEFYRLEADRYRAETADDEGVYYSPIIRGMWLRVDWLWQEPMPRVAEVLREVEGET